MAALDNDDLNSIKGPAEVNLDEKLDENLSYLPTKDKFFTKMDKARENQ